MEKMCKLPETTAARQRGCGCPPRDFNRMSPLITEPEEMSLALSKARYALKSPIVSTRIEAVDILSSIPERCTIQLLLGALMDRSTLVRENAARALAQFGNAVIPELAIVSRSTNAHVRRSVVTVLWKIGNDCAMEVIMKDFVADPHPDVRGYSAWVLGELADPISLSALIKMKKSDPDALVRDLAADAVERIKELSA